MIKSAPLTLENETVNVTVVQCYYEEIKFFVTRADADHVFTLNREPETGIFHLKAGLHKVMPNYTIPIIIDFDRYYNNYTEPEEEFDGYNKNRTAEPNRKKEFVRLKKRLIIGNYVQGLLL